MASVGPQRRSAKRYMRMLSALGRMIGKGTPVGAGPRGRVPEHWMELARKAARFRKRMIYENRAKARRKTSKERELLRSMARAEREFLGKLKKTKDGKALLKRFTSFWGLPTPPAIRPVRLPYFGKRRVTLMGMGWTPALYLAKSRSKGAKPVVLQGKWDVATDSKGKAIFYIPRSFKVARKPKWVKVGWMKSTHYIPPADIEQAGSFKSGAHWRHSHFDDKGTPPEAWLDQANDVFLAVGGTFSVGKWIRR